MDTLQIIDKVNSFYSTSFGHLMTLTLAILAFSGILLPIIIQFLQSRNFRVEQKSLETHISNEVKTTENKLRDVINQLFETKKENIDTFLQKEIESLKFLIAEQISVAKAGTFFLQAVNETKEGKDVEAARDYAHAAKLFLFGKDNLNGQRALRSFIEVCLPKLNASTLELDDNIEELIKQLTARNENGLFKDSIIAIEEWQARVKK